MTIGIVYFPTTFGYGGNPPTTTTWAPGWTTSPPTTTTWAPGWTTKPKCSKYCSGDQTTVCLDGEDVPKCYAECKHKVSEIW